MATKHESSALFYEKQDLDNFLSSLKAAHLPDDIAPGKDMITAEAEKKSPEVSRGESLYLIREKEETDIFLSRIISAKPSAEIVQEKAAVPVETNEKLTVSEDYPAYEEAKVQIQFDEEEQSAEDKLGKIAIAARSKGDMQISLTLPEENRAAEDSLFGVKDTNREQLQTGGQERKDEPVFVKEASESIQVQKAAVQMPDIADAPPSAKVEIAKQAVVDKSERIAGIAPERPVAKKIERPGKVTSEPSKKKSKRVSWGIGMGLSILLLVFIVVMQGYLWIYPEAGYQTIEWIHSNFPIMDHILGIEKPQKQDIITDRLEFINVRQRFVMNESLGNLRVIEGEVVNQADFPVAKIRVMAELFDSSEALLAARMSYCGNVIQDEALSRFKEEEIRSALSVSSGVNLSEGKILPRGQIPFMIVFTHEPPGVAKSTVTAVGAERISP